jgi:hypothetical protein
MEVVVVLVIVVGLIAAAGWATNVRREVASRENTLIQERTALEAQMRQRETLLEQRDTAFRQGYVSGRRWLAACIAEWRQSIDESRENYLRSKPRPGEKSADVVRLIKTEKRALQTELKFLQYQLASYEEYFPFLEEYKEAILDERIALGADRNNIEELEAADPVQLLLEAEEYRRLSSTERNQLALQRYLSRPKSNWEIGRFYERYIGYLREKEAWHVIHEGAIKGYEDFGRDLICTRGPAVEIIQAKCWSQERVVREKHVFQLFGTTVHYRKTFSGKDVQPVFVTTTALSEAAQEVADALGVRVERCPLRKDYPMIKCNINPQTKERIYHLPFDQQYDRTMIGSVVGERYVATTAEAEQLGFRRAWRYRPAESKTGQRA